MARLVAWTHESTGWKRRQSSRPVRNIYSALMGQIDSPPKARLCLAWEMSRSQSCNFYFICDIMKPARGLSRPGRQNKSESERKTIIRGAGMLDLIVVIETWKKKTCGFQFSQMDFVSLSLSLSPTASCFPSTINTPLLKWNIRCGLTRTQLSWHHLHVLAKKPELWHQNINSTSVLFLRAYVEKILRTLFLEHILVRHDKSAYWHH